MRDSTFVSSPRLERRGRRTDRRHPALCTVLTAGLFSIFLPAAASAQDDVIAGTVVAEGSMAPIAGAQIQVAGTQRGTQTDASGRFRLTNIDGTEVTLDVRRLGFRPARVQARVGDQNVRIALAERAIELDAIVVTGTPGATEKRALGNAVSTINAAEVTDKAPVNNLQELLNGRAAGVVVMPASGAVGTGSRIRVRGTSSLSLSNQPLIYVDGVRVNSEAATGPQNQDFGSSSISRLNDINPEEIESIEIIKGPAAATLYGTEASNGVIQIITKRGSGGRPQWNLTMKQGENYLRDPEGRFWRNYQRDAGGNVISIDIVELEKAAGRPIWRDGWLQEYDLAVAGGGDLVTYYLSGGYEDSDGVDPNNRVERYNLRGNVSVAPTERFSLAASLGYVTGRTDLACEAGCGGRVWGTVLADPRNLLPAPNAQARGGGRGFHSGTPEQYDLLSQWWQDLDRFTASFQVNHRPLDWLNHRLNVGADRTHEENVGLTPRVDSLIPNPVWGSSALGSRDQTERAVNLTTIDYAASAVATVANDLRFTTSVGAQYYRTAIDSVFAGGDVFPAPGFTSVNATSTNRVNAQDFLEEKSLGFFIQEEFGWRDRLFLTAGIRSDDHSAFGKDFDRVFYPKYSVSWVVSEEPFWRLPIVSALKLRAAYGETGQQPPNFAALALYEGVSGPGDVAAVTPGFIGNPALGPERGKEIELGFDAGVFDDRLGIELTYYRQETEDAILDREIAPSVGVPGRQFFNAGAIRNTGLELLARARPWDRDPVSVEVTFTLATNDNEVLSLGDLDVPFVSAGSFIRHQVGFPVGAYFEQRIVSADWDAATKTAINVMCDDGQGGAVLCRGPDGRFGGGDDAPEVFLGRPTPDLEGAFSSTITLWERVRLFGLVDFKRGMRKVDGNTRVRCYFFGGRCRENFFPEEFAQQAEVIASLQSSSNLVDRLIADASFTKLREVSVSLLIPDEWTARAGVARASVSLAGRNLATWTDYPGLEPEAMFLGGSRGGQHGVWEQTVMPQLSQWVLTFNIGL